MIEPLDVLRDEGDVLAVYANPNIHGLEEYRRRRDTLMAYAVSKRITVVEVPYEPHLWLEATQGTYDDRSARCRACYALRLRLTAAVAVEHRCEAIATTLTVSPYQDAVAIEEEAQRIARANGLTYIGRDFRERYPQATRRSRELGMYRQNYCGCVLSQVEAEAARARRRSSSAARSRSMIDGR